MSSGRERSPHRLLSIIGKILGCMSLRLIQAAMHRM